MLKTNDINRNPEVIRTKVTLRSGETVRLRPLARTDSHALGDYFVGLSETTKAVYGPHPFDTATAKQLCAEIDTSSTLRMLGIVTNDQQEKKIVAYFIIVLGVDQVDSEHYDGYGMKLNPHTDCTLAPSVTDEYQNSGLGSLMMTHLKELLPNFGYRRMLLMRGVRAYNSRAVHFYRKFGFKNVGSFVTACTNYDMITDL